MLVKELSLLCELTNDGYVTLAAREGGREERGDKGGLGEVTYIHT